jgi:hypothetical protein
MTKSEQIFESFLASHNLTFIRIEESTTPRPDYRVSIGETDLIFELKELTADKNFGVPDPTYPQIKISSATPGGHVRRAIDGSKKQIQFGADQSIPSILLIYNAFDPFQLFGIEDMDFHVALYGEYTRLIDRQTKEWSSTFHGNNSRLQERKNTSFSGVGRLRDLGGDISVKLFENVFASIRIPYEQLPPCLEVCRFEIQRSDVFKQAEVVDD